MCASGEKIDRFGRAEGVTGLGKQLDIAGEGSRIAGDIDDTFRLHGGNGFDHIGAHASFAAAPASMQ